MFKRVCLIITFLAAGSLSAQAGVDGNPFEDFYVGLNFDYSKVTSNTVYTELPATEGLASTFDGINSRNSGSGFGGGLYGGYGLNFGPVYTSLEAGFMVARGNAKISDGTTTVKLGQSNVMGINARVGFVVSDNILLYGLAGFASTKFGVDDGTFNISKRLSGIKYGAGFEVGIMEDIALRVEYTRTRYGSLLVSQQLDVYDFKPRSQSITIGVVLHMN